MLNVQKCIAYAVRVFEAPSLHLARCAQRAAAASLRSGAPPSLRSAPPSLTPLPGSGEEYEEVTSGRGVVRGPLKN